MTIIIDEVVYPTLCPTWTGGSVQNLTEFFVNCGNHSIRSVDITLPLLSGDVDSFLGDNHNVVGFTIGTVSNELTFIVPYYLIFAASLALPTNLVLSPPLGGLP